MDDLSSTNYLSDVRRRSLPAPNLAERTNEEMQQSRSSSGDPRLGLPRWTQVLQKVIVKMTFQKRAPCHICGASPPLLLDLDLDQQFLRSALRNPKKAAPLLALKGRPTCRRCVEAIGLEVGLEEA